MIFGLALAAGVTTGLPAVHSLVSGVPAQLSVRVVEAREGKWDWRCSYILRVAGTGDVAHRHAEGEPALRG